MGTILGMSGSDWLGVLNILVAIIGILFVVITIYEATQLKRIRDDVSKIKQDLKSELFKAQKAMQRVIASYSIQDRQARIALLQEAVEIDPQVFNGYNSLGWAYLADQQTLRAIDAFKEAIRQHPEDKAGYFDTAAAYLQNGDVDMCLMYLRQAINKDPSSIEDLPSNPLFKDLHGDARFKRMLH